MTPFAVAGRWRAITSPATLTRRPCGAVSSSLLVLACGRLERREGTANVIVDSVERLDRPDLPPAKITHIEPRRVWSSDAGELSAVLPTAHSFGRRG